MDDHMIDRITSEIELCFFLMKEEEKSGFNIKDSVEYKAAKILIATHNQLVKIYYKDEYKKEYLKKSIVYEYKLYKTQN